MNFVIPKIIVVIGLTSVVASYGAVTNQSTMKCGALLGFSISLSTSRACGEFMAYLIREYRYQSQLMQIQIKSTEFGFSTGYIISKLKVEILFDFRKM